MDLMDSMDLMEALSPIGCFSPRSSENLRTMAKLSAFFLNFCLLLLALGFAPITRAETPAQSPHDFALWRRLIHRELDGTVVGGYGYEILQHGKVVAAEAKGFARAPWEKVDPSVPFTLDKLAPVASVSKTITAVALLKLWDEKKVRFSLDDPIGPILSRVAPNANPAAQRITIRQVLMHKTGFKAGADVVNRRQLADLLHRPLAYRPGAQFQYQDNNYYLARVILEQLSGESYPRYVKKHVLEPMGVTHMATRAERRQPMCGYGDTDGPRQQGFAFNWDCTRWAGGAGWWGSVDELAKFMHGLRERKVLSEKATAMLFDDALGFDWDEPGFGKGGDWVCPSPTIDGEVHSAVCFFPDDIEAAMIINSPYDQGPLELLEDTWSATRKKPARRHPAATPENLADAKAPHR